MRDQYRKHARLRDEPARRRFRARHESNTNSFHAVRPEQPYRPSNPTDPSSPTDPGVTGDEIDISNAESLGPHSGKAAQKATVTRKMHSCSIRGGNVQMSFDPLGWSTTSLKGKRVDGGVYLFWEQGGKVVGGLFDWHGVGQTSKTLGNVYGENYLGRRPPTGATVYFAIVSLDVKQRTNVKRCSTPWP